VRNKENDRRVQRTKRTLREALVALILEKGYDQVTVQDIIDRADVGRSTFYAHFENKDKLLLSGFEDMREVLTEANTAHQKPEKHTGDFSFNSLMIFQHADENRRIYRALVGRSSGDWFLKQMFRQHYDICRKEIQISAKNENQILNDAAAHFFASSLISLLTFWLDNNLPLTPEQIDELFKQLTMPGLKTIL
jgi:AcrR family transcriptional regulator